MPNESPRENVRPTLDLSLFRLPIFPDDDIVEVPVSPRESKNDTVKRGFWSRIARRVDLTGQNSSVKTMPYGTGHDRPLPSEVRAEKLYEHLSEIENANVILDETKARPLSIHRRVVTQLDEVQPQFFLRNIRRLERDIDVRRLSVRFAVWREDPRPDFEDIRHPELEPLSMVEKFSPDFMDETRFEFYENVMGFVWNEVLLGYYPTPVKIHPFFWEPERIPIGDLSLKPAPPYRYSPEARTSYIMKQLAERTDGSVDE